MKNDTITVIAKPTHNCNLACKYCYVDQRAEKGYMTEKILIQSIKKISDTFKRSHWIWHGGEPLLIGLNFFKQIREIQQYYSKRGNKFRNSIQTNGTLIEDQLLDFIDETGDFNMGLSIDGPKELNDKTRVYRDNSGGFEKIMLGIRKVKERKKGRVGIICVINKWNINRPELLYNFFKNEKLNVQFNPLIPSKRVQENQDELGITPKQYGEFLLKMWKIYNEDCLRKGKVSIDIDPFMEVIGNLGTEKPLGCNYSGACRDNFISIGPKGDIYPCGRFDGVKQFWMGNIQSHTIKEMMESSTNQKLKKRNLETITGCNSCNFVTICNSGCMHNAYLSGDLNRKDPYCASYKILFGAMKTVLDKEIENVKGGKI
jgi:uncharacterized protein